MITVACVSDVHDDFSFVEKVRDAHLVIIAGDIFNTMSYNQIIDSLSYLHRTVSGEVVMVAGNHDVFFSKWKPNFVNMNYKRLHYLEDTFVKILGFNIYGSPWTSQKSFGVFQAGAAQRFAYWNKIPPDTDILVTHSPPLHYRDIIARPSLGENPHQGCPHLHERVMQIKPKLHVFGHIHEGHGMVKDKGITFVNASVRDSYHQYVYDPIIVNLSKSKLTTKP